MRVECHLRAESAANWWRTIGRWPLTVAAEAKGRWIGWGWFVRASPTLTASPGADPMSKVGGGICPAGGPGSY
jgi:hypothetical protein